MGDRIETVTYKVVVDTSDIPAELYPGGGTSRAGGIPHPLPSPSTPSVQVVQVRQMQKQLIATSQQMAKMMNQGMIGGSKQIIGGSLGANGSSIIRGSAGLAGGALTAGASAAGRFGGAGGAIAALAAGAVAYAVVKTITTVIDSLDRLSKTFSRYNAGIAASQAQVTVATTMANIKMAAAMEPVIGAFNKMKIAAIGAGVGLTEWATAKFGPMLESIFGKIESIFGAVAKKFGIDISPHGTTIGNMIPSNFSPRLTGGEMLRGTARGSGTAAQLRAQQALLTQRGKVDLLSRMGYGNSEYPSVRNYVAEQKNALARMESNYTKGRFSGSMGGPIGGKPKMGIISSILLDPILQGTRPEQIASVKRKIDAIQTAIRDRFDPNRTSTIPGLTSGANWFADKMSGLGIQLNHVNFNAMSMAEYNQKQAQLKALHETLARLTFKSSAAHVIPGLKEAELVLMEAQKREGRFSRDPVMAAFANAFSTYNNPKASLKQRVSAHDYMMENMGYHRFVEKEIESAKKEEIEASKKVHEIRQSYFNKLNIHKPKAMNLQDGVPFAALGISQVVNLKMEAKLAHEKDITDTINQIRENLSAGMSSNRNESRLAAMLQNNDRMGVM